LTSLRFKHCQEESEDRVLIAIQTIKEVKTLHKAPSTFDATRLIAEAETGQNSSNTCVVCKAAGHIKPTEPLETHHVAGRSNFEAVTISACLSHHQHLSIMQLKWLVKDTSPENRLASYLFGFSDLFYLMWEETTLNYFQELSKAFAYRGYYFRDRSDKA